MNKLKLKLESLKYLIPILLKTIKFRIVVFFHKIFK
jgi:hypothetical protein